MLTFVPLKYLNKIFLLPFLFMKCANYNREIIYNKILHIMLKNIREYIKYIFFLIFFLFDGCGYL